MRKCIVAFAVLVLMGTVAKAQNCLPITVGQSYTTHDDGQGPLFIFNLNDTKYGNEQYTAGRVAYVTQFALLEPGEIKGYVNVLAGFGGCTADWYWEPLQWYATLIDTTTHTTIWTTAPQPIAATHCGNVPSCAFDYPFTQQNAFPNPLTFGHTYTLTYHMQADVLNIGLSQLYSGTLTIVVSRH